MQEGCQVITVHVEPLLFVNWVMDFTILWVAGKMAGHRLKIGRLIVAALLGAFYALVVFLPAVLKFTSLPLKVLVSCVMVWVGFAPLSPVAFFKTWGYLCLATFAMGGAVFAGVYMTHQDHFQVWNGVAIYQGGFHYSLLVLGLAIAVLLGWGGISFIKKNWLRQSLYSQMRITVFNQDVTLKALLDTGNQLYEPMTQKPVIIVEAKALEGVIPPEMLRMETGKEEGIIQGVSSWIDKEWMSRLHLIPFHSVGKNQGLMMGFRPDRVEIQQQGQVICRNNLIVGIYQGILSKEGFYQALLHPDIFQ